MSDWDPSLLFQPDRRTRCQRVWHEFLWRLRRAREAVEEWWQRQTVGYAYVEVWNLHAYIARYALPRLRHLRAGGPASCPLDMTYGDWQAALDDMIYALDLMVRDEFEDYERLTDEECADMQTLGGRYDRGLDLFGRYWQSLWD